MPLDASRRGQRRARPFDPAPRRDVAREITDEIVALLEAGGELPWRMPWRTAGRGLPLRHEGSAYRGVNVFMLSLRAMGRGYASPYWMSYRQAAELGGQVRKGERGCPVVYYGVAKGRDADVSESEATAGDEGGSGGGYRFLKHFTAFNADQIDGLPERYHPVGDVADGDDGARPIERLAAIMDAMIDGIGVGFETGGDRACYVRALDRIHMPEIGRFHEAERYYATGFHELGHACEHPGRLALDYGEKRFGNEAYARAEVVVELAAAILGATLGFAPDHVEDHAAYVQSWLKALRADPRFILKAAADAQRVADHLLKAAGVATTEA